MYYHIILPFPSASYLAFPRSDLNNFIPVHCVLIFYVQFQYQTSTARYLNDIFRYDYSIGDLKALVCILHTLYYQMPLPVGYLRNIRPDPLCTYFW